MTILICFGGGGVYEVSVDEFTAHLNMVKCRQTCQSGIWVMDCGFLFTMILLL